MFAPSRLETLPLRGITYQVRHWGDAGAPMVFFLHGWMDTSATFQFVVDALPPHWHVVAPDWRGYGGSSFLRRPYWFPDYQADLDALLQHYCPDHPALLVGHSMGASIASLYASARPTRVRALAMLDFLGLKTAPADEAPARLRDWIAEVNADPSSHRLRRYADHAALARRLKLVNPRIDESRAAFLSVHTSHALPGGEVELACDPWHKVPSPYPYRVEEMMACWRTIEAPVLLAFAEHGYVRERFGTSSDELQRRLSCFSRARVSWVADAGHNLQHDQPEAVAMLLDDFLRAAITPSDV